MSKNALHNLIGVTYFAIAAVLVVALRFYLFA